MDDDSNTSGGIRLESPAPPKTIMQRAWDLLCKRLQRDAATSEEDETCSLRAACKAMVAFHAYETAGIGCIHTHNATGLSPREDLARWQADRSEFFDPTILGIVQEYAEWRDAQQLAEAPLTTLQRLGQEFDAGEGRCGDKGLTLCQACSLPAHELTQSPGCGAPMQKPSAWAVDDEKVEVTQADRDMAADVLFHVDDDPFVDNIREGWEDDSYLVQAFARHRASHSATAEPVGLREAVIQAMAGKVGAMFAPAMARNVAEELADAAMAALATPSQPDPQSRGQAFDGEGEELGRFGHHPDARIDYECETDALIGMAYDRLTGMAQHGDLEYRILRAMEFRTTSTPGELRWLSQKFNGTCEIYAIEPECMAALSSAKRGEEG